jgi:hypothetical protein
VFATVGVVTAAIAFKAGTATGTGAPLFNALRHRAPVAAPVVHPVKHTVKAPATFSADVANGLIETYCKDCHNDNLVLGNQSFDGLDVGKVVPDRVHQEERMIRKLRAEMMPLPGAPRPSSDTLQMLAETMEQFIDKAEPLNPGTRVFPRLNRTEYENAVKDLLAVDVDAGDYLPLDTKSANFDNIADVQMMSTTLLESYLNAAQAVTRIALGDKNATPLTTTYKVSPFASQHPWDHVEGAPYGTRGGLVVTHNFPADGYYKFVMQVEGGVGIDNVNLDVSIDNERKAYIEYEHGVNPTNGFADKPLGVDIYNTDSIFVKAGQHTVAVTFVRGFEGPYEDLIRPHDWSHASNGNASTGTTSPPGLVDFSINGPVKTTGVSETPSRKIIFSCRPSKSLSDKACADQIITRLATKAYRRPLTARDKDGLMKFYADGAKKGGFEGGIANALQAMLSSPYFVFRFETTPAGVQNGQDFQVSDIDLASRLSFFLWGSIPDETLLSLAQKKQLSQPAVLRAQVKRMLADPRSSALSTRFAAQWLRLQDIDKVHPDAYYFPDFDQSLADDMKKETELFFDNIVKGDKSILEMLTANYTFVNGPLARHYGIPNVSGNDFRRVNYPDDNRRGILGQGTYLVQTSFADRTSPVLRGKWIMEVLIGMPPPPPPPNIPSLDETADGNNGKPLTTRQRMELHRKNPTCKACHQYMDPIGLAMDNFDVTGRWRYRENAVLLDTQGNYYDGTPISSPKDLEAVLLKRPIPLVRSFTENLMAYALGRRVEDYDQPMVRKIAREAAADNYRFSSFVDAVVTSPEFLTKRADVVAADQKDSKQQ